jgi:MerR family transcriptional regulator, thiopeptide resistance regulator
MLRLQRDIIARKRRHLDSAIAAIKRAEQIVNERGQADVEAFKQIIDVINMENNMNWMMQYHTEEARRKIEERTKEWTPEKQVQRSADWAALFKEVDAAIADGTDPASEHAQQLAARWDELVRGFTGDDPEVIAGLKRLYADQANWPSTFKKPFKDEQAAFVNQARACRRKEE